MITKTDLFRNEFPNFEIEIVYCTLNDFVQNDRAIVIFINNISNEQLESNWNYINSWAAANVQLDFETEFEIWNLYLIFIVNEPIEKGLKYKIENDTFSSRKIIIEESISKKEIIDDHIINILKNYKEVVAKNEFEDNSFKNEIISSIIEIHGLLTENNERTKEALNTLSNILKDESKN